MCFLTEDVIMREQFESIVREALIGQNMSFCNEIFSSPKLTEDTIQYILQVWSDGYLDGNFVLALMYLNTLGEIYETPNYPAAIELLEETITLNNPYAMLERAHMFRHGQGELNNQPNYPEAIRLYDRAIELNDKMAMNDRACMFRDGQGEPNNTPNTVAAEILFNKVEQLIMSPIRVKVYGESFYDELKEQFQSVMGSILRKNHTVLLNSDPSTTTKTSQPLQDLLQNIFNKYLSFKNSWFYKMALNLTELDNILMTLYATHVLCQKQHLNNIIKFLDELYKNDYFYNFCNKYNASVTQEEQINWLDHPWIKLYPFINRGIDQEQFIALIDGFSVEQFNKLYELHTALCILNSKSHDFTSDIVSKMLKKEYDLGYYHAIAKTFMELREKITCQEELDPLIEDPYIEFDTSDSIPLRSITLFKHYDEVNDDSSDSEDDECSCLTI